MWQTSSRVNLSVLIGSYLIRILPQKPFRRARSSAVHVIFLAKAKFPKLKVKKKFQCHILNLFLNSLARTAPGNIDPQSFLWGPCCARSVLPKPRPNSSARPLRSVSQKLLYIFFFVFTSRSCLLRLFSLIIVLLQA